MSLPPLIAHIVFSFDIGGLENGVVNLINHSDSSKFRHVIICLSHYTDFFKKIEKKDVKIYALDKKSGKDLPVFWRLYKLLRKIKPDIVHTRNMATLECQFPTLLAGVSARVHGEHGWDVGDIAGGNKKYQFLRKLFVPIVKQYIALSKEGCNYLLESVGIPKNKINHIYNGVDIKRFSANNTFNKDRVPTDFIQTNSLIFGTVGRMAEVKNQLFLVRAFLHLLDKNPQFSERLRLIIVGDGILMAPAQKLVNDYCEQHQCKNQWVYFAGASNQVNAIMRLMNVFVLPSIAEGISNTILESMASSLPVIATDVGGNSELVIDNKTGYIIPVNNIEILSNTMEHYLNDPDLINKQGEAGRNRIEDNFSLQDMVKHYEDVYSKVLN
ncbi:MAG: TIGR03088 family PEP-CTERM/XrtA system glycosyltransferase [Gammaproteobacteria bacterium]|nr:TIGR03088 family PEP-CTERM/XrtA system glycosyltransferase [Gammaproteobacteria bacterium]